jgi:hypothetical protein
MAEVQARLSALGLAGLVLSAGAPVPVRAQPVQHSVQWIDARVQVPAGQPASSPGAGPQAPSADALRQWQAREKDPALDARYKVRLMEGVLEKSVMHAVRLMNQQLQTVSPDLVQLTGATRARGYRLDGYGLFFDVEVPAAMRQTMGWTVRMLRQQENAERALEALRRITSQLEGKTRSDAELAVRQLELQVRPPVQVAGGSYGSVVTTVTTASSTGSEAGGPAAPGAAAAALAPAPGSPAPAESAAPGVVVNPLLLQHPDLAYELEVRESLIAAMLEWGSLLPLRADEWLTVAARDNQDVVIPGEAADVVTIIMRVKGSDLTEFKAGRLAQADIRKRVEVREF